MSDLQWHDVATFGVEGKGWADTKSFYDRLPARAEGVVPPDVWSLSHNCAGLCAHFNTDATRIEARWQTLPDSPLALDHMPASGVSGLDFYVRHETLGYRFFGVGRTDAREQTKPLGQFPDRAMRRCRLHLPLYNGVIKLEIGVDADATFEPVRPRTDKPIVYFGTSITQGGCASRPGMAFPAIIGRRIDRPHINLGFSGFGKCETEVIDLLCELDACVFVIDTVANMDPALIDERMAPGVRQLRAARPDTPILMVESAVYQVPLRLTGQHEPRAAGNVAMQRAYDTLIAEGVTGLYYLRGEGLLSDDCEGTVDGAHPTDLGFMHMADAITPVLQCILDG